MKKVMVIVLALVTSSSVFASTYECSLRMNDQVTTTQTISVGEVKNFGQIGKSSYYGFLLINSDGYANADFTSSSENLQPNNDMVSVSGTADLNAKDIQLDANAFGTTVNVSCNKL